jgi:hypothetical protein
MERALGLSPGDLDRAASRRCATCGKYDEHGTFLYRPSTEDWTCFECGYEGSTLARARELQAGAELQAAHFLSQREATTILLTRANALLELAWGLIANVDGGQWKQGPQWEDAANRWREQFKHPMNGGPEEKDVVR